MTLMYVVLGNITYKRVIALIKFFESRKNQEKRELFLRYNNYKKKTANFGWLLKHQRGGSISSDEWNSKKYTNKLQMGRRKFRAKVFLAIIFWSTVSFRNIISVSWKYLNTGHFGYYPTCLKKLSRCWWNRDNGGCIYYRNFHDSRLNLFRIRK